MANNSNKYIQVFGGFTAVIFGLLQGIDWLFNKYEIDNYYFNIILIILFVSLIVGLLFFVVKRKAIDIKSNKKLFLGLATLSIIIIGFIFFFKKINNNENLLNQTIPELITLYDNGDLNNVFLKTKSLLKDFPENETIKNYYNKSKKTFSLKTNYDGIGVSVKYGGDSIFNYLGKTPLDSFSAPNTWNSHVLKFEYNDSIYYASNHWLKTHNYFFPSKSIEIPKNHKFFLGTNISLMWFLGVEFKDTQLLPFSISKNEVSNSQYQKFVDAGGYENPKYWDFPFKIGDRIYDFNSTIKLFTDRYGKYGPANWSYGKFPSGLDNHPVTGISWFEARAFAKYSNMSLPNVYQWLYSSGVSEFVVNKDVVDNSNYNSSQTRETSNSDGSFNELNNIAGNVKEWVSNPNGLNNEKFSLLGGSYLEYSYTFNNYYSISPLNRGIGNGMRLAKTLSDETSDLNDKAVPEYIRDVTKIPDISEEVFNVYKSQFEYGEIPLNSKTENIENFVEGYNAQRFEMKTTYESDENLFGYIVYSNKVKDKYDPVIVYPSAGAIVSDNDTWMPKNLLNDYKYLIDEGYAIIHPIYHNTYSRTKTYSTFTPDESENYRNTIIKIGQDFKRSLDYIESRNDFSSENLSYYGYSWGSTTSNYLLAIDDRVKSAFICAGGLMPQKSKKEIEAHYYIRRTKTPIFHIVGKLDGIFGPETYNPWKKLIGTPRKDLRTIEYDDYGHGIPKDTIIKYHSEWIRKYSVN